MTEDRYASLRRLFSIINEALTLFIRIVGIAGCIACGVVWAVTDDHVYQPYIIGLFVSMTGGSFLASAWQDLSAAKKKGA